MDESESPSQFLRDGQKGVGQEAGRSGEGWRYSLGKPRW